jgi:5-methylthioribose kinase
VEKYPQFAAPRDRALRERDFYLRVTPHPGIARLMPRLLAWDAAARVLVLEDLGSDGDYTDLYRGCVLTHPELDTLAGWLSLLHHAVTPGAEEPPLANREMRALNHAHIFEIPFARENGLDLDLVLAGLAAAAAPLKADPALIASVAALGREVYLADGPCLLHGDVFPGSFVRTRLGLRIIDPEFCFLGRPEWDVGVLLAHLWLARQPADLRHRFLRQYTGPPGFDPRLALRLAGVEIIRRLIGYAQLPLSSALAERQQLLELARTLVLTPGLSLLKQPTPQPHFHP